MKLTKQRIEENVIRETFLSVLPIQAIAAALPNLNTLINSLIISNSFGSIAMAAMGLMSPFNYVITAVSTMLGIGSQLACGKYLGEGNKEKMQEIFCTNIILSILIGAILSLVTYFSAGSIATLLGANEETWQMTADYLRGYSFGLIFVILTPSILPFLQLDNAKALSTISVTVMLALNVGLNILNVTVFKLQMTGAGIATSVATMVSMLVCIPHFAGKNGNFRLSFRNFSLASFGEIASKGYTSALPSLLYVFRDRLLNFVVMAIGGNVLLAAVSVYNQMCIFGCVMQNGYQGATNMLGSVLVGERDIHSLERYGRITLKLVFPVYVFFYAILFAFARPIAVAFNAPPEHVWLYATVLRTSAIFFITNAFKNLSLSLYKVLKMNKAVTVFTLLNDFIFPVSIALLAYATDSLFLIISYSYLSEMCLIISYVIYYRIKTGRFPTAITDITYIPDNVSVPVTDRLAFTINSLEDATLYGMRVSKFCRGKGFSEEESLRCGKCVEDYGAAAVRGRFLQDKKPLNTIDTRVFFEANADAGKAPAGRIRLLFRDNGLPMDMDSYPPAGDMKNMTQNSVLGMNVVTAELR